MTLLIIVLILALLWVLAVQGRSSHPGMKELRGWNYAHRGLHGDGAAENSMTAFRLAVENGYGMEFDLHLLKDGNLGVMHDSLLNRTTGQAGRIEDLYTQDLKNYRLENTEDTIPQFADVLTLVDGKVPLIIELKAERGNHAQLAEATCAMLDRFRVNYCIESFDPRCILWLKKHRPLIIRGQLSEQFLRHGESGGGHGRLTMWLLGNLLTNVATQPDFIAYRFSDRENLCLRLCHKVYHVQEVNWTIRAKEEMEAAEQAGNLVIFECFDPEV
jgi:glycerophosphoryl diester phosphodiesterase